MATEDQTTFVQIGDKGWEPASDDVEELVKKYIAESEEDPNAVVMPVGHPAPPPAPLSNVVAQQLKAKQDRLTKLVKSSSQPAPVCDDFLARLDAAVIKDSLTPDEFVDLDGVFARIEHEMTKAGIVEPVPDFKMEDYDESEHVENFTHKYRERLGIAPEQLAAKAAEKHKAFLEFFDLAGKLNESAHAFGIKSATLDADTGEVTVVYRTRERPATTP